MSSKSHSISGPGKILLILLVPVMTLVIGLILVETGLHWLAENHYGKGKLFTPDPMLGWRNLADLNLSRTNANGDSWQVVTDKEGLRETSEWRQDADKRLLIMGDSLAFGEGVNIEQRFDSILGQQNPRLSIVNTATMGYGTFQQILRGRPYFADLSPGDKLLLVTCSNDFTDITRSTFAARSKPQILFDQNSETVESFPGISVIGWLRDKSYIASRAMAFFFEDTHFSADSEKMGLKLYANLIRQELMPLAESGVQIILAYYDYMGHADTNQQMIGQTFRRLCAETGNSCIDINSEVLRDPANSNQVLADGHWNSAGHLAVSRLIAPLL